ncbi:achaete-scute homolog 1b-like [Sitodiplosis mosellana]|uniref:achaete-scute homolog 1b-like n=1 Tax=Sitodiplosis mosellana TaxID=263140 RepID=UPI002443AC6F|nr:achaete-scute homolog 1b-like [Sitodiplosis mosellana]
MLGRDLKDYCLRGEDCTHQKFSLAIEKRNFRERNRVRAINIAFQELRLTIPSISQRNKRTSKVKILLKAIQYIKELEILLE